MDHIGFSELVLLGIIALIVLGPEKLPGAIRTASLWIGRMKRSFNTIKTDIEREIGADEIRRQLRNEAIMDKFKQTKAQVNDAVNTVKKQTDEFRKNIELEAKTIESATAPVTTKPAIDKGANITALSPLAGAPAPPAGAPLVDAPAPAAPAESTAVTPPAPAATTAPAADPGKSV
jgi:sec-independent protein translocase protein TatB